jgi:hypothetical protein
MIVKTRNKEGWFLGSEFYEPPVALYDPLSLNKGGQCYNNNYQYHERDKAELKFHFMLSKVACTLKNC